MTPEEIINVLREVDADAKASEGDYYADQFAWHGAGEIADAVEQMAAEIARLRKERLTADERSALELSLELEWPKTSEQWKALAACLGPVCLAPANRHKVAIRGLLDRQPLPPGPEANG